MTDPLWLYVIAGVLFLAWYLWRQRRSAARDSRELQEAIEAGLHEPPSLHPVIDPVRCLGSASCVTACPEGAIGIVGGKAVLKNGAACIGHGACRAACPHDAITLVFGTESRGIDIPALTPQFETNVPGLFIAGELGGMGLIRKAAEQGRQAVDAIRRRGGEGFEHDLVIVGAGPAGLSAALAATEHRLRFRLIEQEPSLGGAVFHYPRHKVAMTAPVTLALVGKLNFREVSKERLLEFWEGVVAKTGLRIEFNERLEGIDRDGEGFVVRTNRGAWRARSVLLAMGRRGTPRRLGVPGEEQPKVVYRLVDPAQYAGQRVLVVGGGDSALEAAIALAGEAGTDVVLSYRSEAFSRVKKPNRDRLEALRAEGRVRVLLSSQGEESGVRDVRLKTAHGRETLPNDAVIVCAGGLLPTPLLQQAGIRFDTKFGTA